MKRMMSFVFALIISCTMLIPALAMAEDVTDENKVDVVFVIDDTKSMKTNDPKKLTKTAVSKYMDVVSGFKGNIGIVTFAEDVMKKKSLTSIDSSTDNVISFMDKNIKQNGSCTNCAKGIKEAVSILNSSTSDKKAIILVTDGEYDFDAKPNKTEDQQTEEAENLLKQQVDKANTKKISIYSIKIENPNSKKTDNDGKVEFELFEKHYTAKNAQQVEDHIKNIRDILYPLIDEGETKSYELEKDVDTPTTFEVPSGAYFANIQINHTHPVEIVSFKYADGNDVNHDPIERDGYINVRVPAPKKGKMTIVLRSKVEQTATISYVIVGSTTVKAELSKNDPTTKETFNVTAKVYSEGELCKDVGSSIGVIAKVKDNNGTEVAKYNMDQETDGSFTCECGPIKTPGDYKVYVQVNDINGKEKDSSEELSLSVSKAKINPLLFIIPIALLLIAAIIVIVLLLTKPVALPFGRFQYNYTNRIKAKNAINEVWMLDNYVSKKNRTVSVYKLMQTYHPEVAKLDAVIFSATGNAKTPVLQITNNDPDNINVFVDSMSITNNPCEIRRGSVVIISYNDGADDVEIRATRI